MPRDAQRLLEGTLRLFEQVETDKGDPLEPM
jgi:hypothetical protein